MSLVFFLTHKLVEERNKRYKDRGKNVVKTMHIHVICANIMQCTIYALKRFNLLVLKIPNEWPLKCVHLCARQLDGFNE